jgi:hypothetical protein
MLELGFIKIHRKLIKSFFYKDSEYVSLWVHCLLRANWEDKKVLFNGAAIDLRRGQFICGRKSLSKEIHINEYKVRRILDVFESAHQIEQHKTNKYTIITITNYDKYQGDAQDIAHQTHIKRTSNRQQTHTDKEYKEVKEHKEYTGDFETFWKAYPKRIAKQDAWRAWVKIKDTAQVLIAVNGYRAIIERDKTEPKYIKHPTTFLNGERWRDYLPGAELGVESPEQRSARLNKEWEERMAREKKNV